MATVIKLKRGTSTPTTGNLLSGEVGVDTSAQKFYINDSGSIKAIGVGNDATTSIKGIASFDSGDFLYPLALILVIFLYPLALFL